MDDRADFRITRRTVLKSGTATAAFLLGGFPRIGLAAEEGGTDEAATPISVELHVNGREHHLHVRSADHAVGLPARPVADSRARKRVATMANAALAQCRSTAAASTHA